MSVIPHNLNTSINEIFNWQHFHVIESTNDFLIASQKSNQLVSADQQSKGKGRRDNKWIANSSSALFSLSFESSSLNDFSRWPINVAIIVSELLNMLLQHNNLSERVLVKWPNDLYIFNGKEFGKFGGILIESSIGGTCCKIVTGIGINLSSVQSAISTDYPTAHLNLDIDKMEIIPLLANALSDSWCDFKLNPVICPQKFQSIDYLQGKKIIAFNNSSQDSILGIACGINGSGHLLLKKSNNDIVELNAHYSVRITDE